MSIQHAIWKVGSKPEPLTSTQLPSEKVLEDMIVHSPDILSQEWMFIGRQVKTQYGGIIDLLAIAPDGSLVLIELKRDKTPREIVAQSLDYASWVADLESDKIAQIYEGYSGGGNLNEAFLERFGDELDEESLNQSHQIIIVAAELDASTERIITYLNARDLPINAIFFQVFALGAEKLLSRAWLIDPSETQANAATPATKKGSKLPWNGEYYVSFGDMQSRSWEDARRFGYISAGGGAWYSQTLHMLSPGDRVWVKIPKTGYVGVATASLIHLHNIILDSRYSLRWSGDAKCRVFCSSRKLGSEKRVAVATADVARSIMGDRGKGGNRDHNRPLSSDGLSPPC